MTTPPMSSRIMRASRESVRRAGRVTQAPSERPADADQDAQHEEVRAEQQQAPEPAVDAAS